MSISFLIKNGYEINAINQVFHYLKKKILKKKLICETTC